MAEESQRSPHRLGAEQTCNQRRASPPHAGAPSLAPETNARHSFLRYARRRMWNPDEVQPTIPGLSRPGGRIEPVVAGRS